MTEQPTTAAGRELQTVYNAPLDAAYLTDRILAIEAEAHQQDGSALRLLAILTDPGPNTYPPLTEDEDSPEQQAWIEEHRNHNRRFLEAHDAARALLAAPPPSAPPALDVERLQGLDDCQADRRAICEAVETEWYNGNLGEDVMDRILAVRLQEPER